MHTHGACMLLLTMMVTATGAQARVGKDRLVEEIKARIARA